MMWDAVEDPFLTILYDIGLEPGAAVIIDIKVHNGLPPNGTHVVILTMAQWSAWTDTLTDQPMADGTFNEYLVAYWRHPVLKRLKMNHTIRDVGERRFIIGIYNPKMVPLVLNAKVKFVNPDGNHLPMQWTNVAPWYHRANVAFIALAIFMVPCIRLARHGCCSVLHFLLVVCIYLKAQQCSLTGMYLEHMNRDGVAPPWTMEKVILIGQLHDMSETLLLLLIALGWTVLRPRLSHTETRFVILAMGSGSFLSLFQVLNEGDPNPDAESVSVFYMIVKGVCFLVVFFASSVNVQLINMHLSDSPVTQTIALLYEKRTLYQRFRHLFFAIFLKPFVRVWFQFLVFRSNFTDTWVMITADNFYQWAVYLGLGFSLRSGTVRRGYMELLDFANREGMHDLPDSEDDEPQRPADGQQGSGRGPGGASHRSRGGSLRSAGALRANGRRSGSAQPEPPPEIIYPAILDGDYMPLAG